MLNGVRKHFENSSTQLLNSQSLGKATPFPTTPQMMGNYIGYLRLRGNILHRCHIYLRLKETFKRLELKV